MDTKKRNYRAECLEVMNLPEGTPDSVILKNLQSLMAQWHPDRSNFTDNEARRKAEDYYKKLNELRQGLTNGKRQKMAWFRYLVIIVTRKLNLNLYMKF